MGLGRMEDQKQATKERLLDSAEDLFAERGFSGTSLRAVTDAAGANIAAVNYHFGSKEGLLRAVVGRAMSKVNELRARLLDDLEASTPVPDVESVVSAFVSAGLDLTRSHGHRSERIARFVGRVIFDPSPQMRELFAEEVDEVEDRYRVALIRALPELSADEVSFRYQAMVGLLGMRQSGALADRYPASEVEPWLITLLIAALRAPATRSLSDRPTR